MRSITAEGYGIILPFSPERKRSQSKWVSLMRHQGERHVPALKSDFLCDVCDFIKLAYFTQCLQRCTLW